MSTHERQLRLVQVPCIGTLLTSIRISLRVQGTTHGSSLIQWIVIVLALSCAVQGFTLQRQIVKDRPRPPQRRLRRSTPFSRWSAGNLVRLPAAAALGLSRLFAR